MTLFPQLSNFLFSPRHRRGLSRFGYGVNLIWCFHRAAYFVDRILKGARPSDLPVEFPTNLELVINLQAAKALGLTVSPILLARADKLIE